MLLTKPVSNTPEHSHDPALYRVYELLFLGYGAYSSLKLLWYDTITRVQDQTISSDSLFTLKTGKLLITLEMIYKQPGVAPRI